MNRIFLLLALLLSLKLTAKCQSEHNLPGTLDSSFGTNGKTIVSTLSRCKDVVVLPNNKVAALDLNKIVCLNADGTADHDFGSNGIIEVDRGKEYNLKSASNLAAQSDGRLLALSYGWDVRNETANAIAIHRFLPNGSLDSSFGENGVAQYSFTGETSNFILPTSLILQKDGKILAGGIYYYDYQNLDNALFVVRFNANGSLDQDFGDNGETMVDDFFYTIGLGHLALQSDGKIIFGFGLSTDNLESKPNILRLLLDGSRDENFGNNGIRYSEFGNNGYSLSNIAVQPDDKIIGVGTKGGISNPSVTVARYNADGSIDSTFGQTGLVTTKLDGLISYAIDVLLQKDNRIVTAGSVKGITENINKLLLECYTSEGVLDSSFGDNGISLVDFYDLGGPNSNSGATAVAQTSTGKIVAGGSASAQDNLSHLAVSRYYGYPVNTHPLITKIKRWIRNHILNFESTNDGTMAYYAIEKQTGTGSFKQVASIPANAANSYSYNLVTAGTTTTDNNYRIKGVAKKGDVVYSDLITDAATVAASFKVYPNPAQQSINISTDKPLTLRLQNSSGVVLLTQKINGSGKMDISKLRPGIYYLVDAESGVRVGLVKE